jgi:hypothetical protein
MAYEKTRAALAAYHTVVARISGNNPDCDVTEQYYQDLRLLAHDVRAALAKETGDYSCFRLSLDSIERKIRPVHGASN